MQFHYHLALILRHWKALLTWILMLGICFGIYGWTSNSKPYEGTLFLSIGSNSPNVGLNGMSSYDSAQAADSFTETIQGWFKNPSLIQRMEEKGKESIGIAAKRQEKQNLVITFEALSEQKAAELAEIIQKEIIAEIDQYNKVTGSQFKMALASLSVTKAGIKDNLFVIVGLLLGVLAGIAYSYKIEYITGKISFPEKISLLLGRPTDAILKRGKTDILIFTNAYLEKEGLKNMNILLMTDVFKKQSTQLEKNNIWIYPENMKEVAKHHKEPILLIFELGKTTTHDLLALKALLPEKTLIITIY